MLAEEEQELIEKFWTKRGEMSPQEIDKYELKMLINSEFAESSEAMEILVMALRQNYAEEYISKLFRQQKAKKKLKILIFIIIISFFIFLLYCYFF